jgi:hypothetical protein
MAGLVAEALLRLDGNGVYPPLPGQYGGNERHVRRPTSTVPGQTRDTITVTVTVTRTGTITGDLLTQTTSFQVKSNPDVG